MISALLAVGTGIAAEPDRSAPPLPPAPVPWPHADPIVLWEDGPARVLGVDVDGSDDAVVRVLWPGAFAWRDADLMTLEAVWPWGTDGHPSWDLDDALEQLGGGLSVSVLPDLVVVEADARGGALVPLAALVGEVVTTPELHRNDVRVAARDVRRPRVSASADRSADEALLNAWYGPITGRPSGGGVRAAWRAVVSAPPVVLVVGDLDVARSRVATSALADLVLPADPSPMPVGPSVAAPDAVFVAVDVPGADRVSIRLRASAPAPGDPDDAAFSVLGFALAESYTSRLYRELVTARGLAYDVHGTRIESHVDPLYTVEVSVPRDRVGEAVDVIEAAIGALAGGGPTRGDAVGAHAAAVRRWNEAFASAASAADFYEPLVVLGLGVAGARARLDALALVTPADVARAAQAWLGPDRLRWVLAGERAAIEAGLPGHPIVWQRQ